MSRLFSLRIFSIGFALIYSWAVIQNVPLFRYYPLINKFSLTDLADKVGITLANLSILKTGKAKAIRFSTLAAICAALDCQPGDLLQFVPDRKPARLGRAA